MTFLQDFIVPMLPDTIINPSFDTAREQITEGSELIATKMSTWIFFLIYMLPNALLAVLVLVVFYLLSKYASKWLGRLLNRVTSSNLAVNRLIANFVSIVIFIIGLSIALAVMQWDRVVASLLAGAGLMGLAIGLAFQDIISNFISGIIIAVKNPYHIGDLIETNNFFGTIKKANFRATMLETTDGRWVTIPNRKIIENPIINYSRTGKRRVDIMVGVAYEEDLARVKQVTLKAIQRIKFVDKSKPVDFFYTAFGDSSVNFIVRFWVQFGRSQTHYLKAKSEAIMVIHKTFKKQAIDIPFPIRTINWEGNGNHLSS